MTRKLGTMVAAMIGCCAAMAEVRAQDEWTSLSLTPSARGLQGSGTGDGTVIYFGGIDTATGTVLDETHAYIPLTDSWTARSAMPGGRAAMGSLSIGGLVYCFGGVDAGGAASASVYVYDPALDVWSTLADMPTSRSELTCSGIGAEIFAIGGRSDSAVLDTVEAYSITFDTWESRATLPAARAQSFSGAIAGRIIIAGGLDADEALATDTWSFNPAMEFWTGMQGLPFANAGGASFVMAGRLYCLGGTSGLGATTSNLEFNPAINRWNVRASLAAGLVGGTAQVAGATPFAWGHRDDSSLATVHQAYTLPDFGTAPNAPTALDQRQDGGSSIPAGEVGSPVQFDAILSDDDGAEDLRLEIEVRLMTEVFTGQPTLVGDWSASANHVTDGMTFAGGYYQWQARAMDENGNASAWVGFGIPGSVDFIGPPVITNPGSGAPLPNGELAPFPGAPGVEAGSGGSSAGCSGSATSAHGWSILALVLIVAGSFLRRK